MEVLDTAALVNIYEIGESEYIRKAEVHEDQLAAAEREGAEELRAEIDNLESRIEELTEFESGMSFHTQSNADP